MKKQVTQLIRWIEIDGNEGTTCIPFDDVFSTQNKKTLNPSKEIVKDYYPGREIYTISVRDGYGSRLSMPGYMDCADWTVYDTEQEAIDGLNEMYPDDEEIEA